MLRILNVEPEGYSSQAAQRLARLGDVTFQEFDRTALLEAVRGVDILIVRLQHQVDNELIEAATDLKAIVSATTGLDHIDTNYAQRKGVTVLSLRGETEFLNSITATAEHTWALLLALIRRIPWAHHSTVHGSWNRDAFRGRDLASRRLGILGFGRLGRIVARYGLAFGMEVYAYDVMPRTADAVTFCSSMENLLEYSDVLSVHVPLNRSTTRLLGTDAFDRLPADALLINTSRGQVIDEVALVSALKSGRLAGAALDVLASERDGLSSDSAIHIYARQNQNLLLTPHIGGATQDSMWKTEEFMVAKLAKWIRQNAT